MTLCGLECCAGSIAHRKSSITTTVRHTRKQQAVINDVYLLRQKTIDTLIVKLSALIPETIHISAIDETQWQHFTITGWGNDVCK